MRRVSVEVAMASLVVATAAGAGMQGLGVESRVAAMDLVAMYVGLGAGLLGALRFGRVDRRAVSGELVAIGVIVLSSALAVGVALVLAEMLWPSAAGGVRQGGPVAAFSSGAILAALTALVAYASGRGGWLLWARWNRLRRSRLLWALTHAQLIAALTLAVAVAAALTAFDVRAGPSLPPQLIARIEPESAGSVSTLLAVIVFRVMPAAGALLVMSALVAVAVLPFAALVSFAVLRRATRRVEQLAAAVSALQRGDLTARITVGGQDEIAALQIAVNSMASELERTLRELESERDRAAGLLEARRQLVASVSHELRTPLATARGYLDAALADSEEASTDLATVRRELARLERLVDDLFAVSRAELGRLEMRLGPVDVGALVRRLVETAAPLAWHQRRVELFAQIAPDVPEARVDALRLEQVVGNLVANATRHTQPGGLVVVAVDADTDDVRIEVRDTGEGIADDALPRIFDRFYKGKDGGAGLGLAVVKELTEAMGGSVAAASMLGEGSCFTVRLRQNRDT